MRIHESGDHAALQAVLNKILYRNSIKLIETWQRKDPYFQLNFL